MRNLEKEWIQKSYLMFYICQTDFVFLFHFGSFLLTIKFGELHSRFWKGRFIGFNFIEVFLYDNWKTYLFSKLIKDPYTDFFYLFE